MLLGNSVVVYIYPHTHIARCLYAYVRMRVCMSVCMCIRVWERERKITERHINVSPICRHNRDRDGTTGVNPLLVGEIA